jgi:hypothetical protein
MVGAEPTLSFPSLHPLSRLSPSPLIFPSLIPLSHERGRRAAISSPYPRWMPSRFQPMLRRMLRWMLRRMNLTGASLNRLLREGNEGASFPSLIPVSHSHLSFPSLIPSLIPFPSLISLPHPPGGPDWGKPQQGRRRLHPCKRKRAEREGGGGLGGGGGGERERESMRENRREREIS